MNELGHWPGISEPLPNARLRVISLGAGVQSSTLALMAARGEIGPMPDAAIFADTQWEPRKVYDWLDWLETQLPFPVYRVTEGSLRELIGAKRPIGKFRKVDIPAYVSVDGQPGGLLNRSCTRDYKIVPIERQVRKLLGLTGRKIPDGAIVEQWIGISTDEIQRMKRSRNTWQQNRFPLIERRFSRRDCIEWMRERQYPEPTKSSCIGCPFHSDSEWRDIAADPAAWADAIEIDERLRENPPEEYRSRGTLFLHRSCKPLRDADLRAGSGREINLFENECEGMCGV